MNYRGLNPDDIEIFSEAISTFFKFMTDKPAQVRTAYLLDQPEPIVWDDFNGAIRVSGGFRGTVTFSAPRDLLFEVLKGMGEKQQTTEHFLDVVGEIANMMSGRARRHFGEALDIAPPVSCERESTRIAKAAEGPAYAIPLTWGKHEAHLVVHLDLARR